VGLGTEITRFQIDKFHRLRGKIKSWYSNSEVEVNLRGHDMQPAEDPFTTIREYVSVRPSTEELDPNHIRNTLRSLHSVGRDRHVGVEWPIIEMQLATRGADSGVSYRFGSDDVPTDRLKRILERAFPNTYELTETTDTVADWLVGDAMEEAAESPLEDRSFSALEVKAREDRRGDWQTQLQSFDSFSGDLVARWPLSDVVAALSTARVPVVFQVLLEPKPDWTVEADVTIEDLHYPQYGFIGGFVADMIGPVDEDRYTRRTRNEIPPMYLERIEEIEKVNTRQSFNVNVRAVAAADGPHAAETALHDLASAFSDVGKTTYQLVNRRYEADSSAAMKLMEDLASRRLRGFSRGRRLEQVFDVSLPFTSMTHPRIVADPKTAGNFCFIGGANLTEEAQRALETQPGERTGQPLPPDGVLERYQGSGYALGYPQTGNRDSNPTLISLPPLLQRRHMLVAGQTGSGKSIWAVIGLLANYAATDGATVIFEGKDAAMADDYERAHFAEYGSLENVYRFNAAERVPATPFFDVTRQQASGIARSQAVEDITDHTEEILRAIMGAEQYDRAIASPLVIEALVKAMFDPVHGSDQFTLADLQMGTQRFADTGHAPPVTDQNLRRELQRITENSDDTFTEIVAGAARRIAQAALDSRVAPLFNYAPEAEESGGFEPFDWRRKLDEDCVIIIDTSDLRQEPQRVVTLVILSQLWTALRRRDKEMGHTGGEQPLVNVHIEEAADVAASGILADILQKGRSYGVGVTLSLQYPRQLKRVDEATYQEALNNIGTVVTGRVEHDRALAERLATDDMPPESVANRLRGLAPGEWFVTLPATFGADPPRPFQVNSLPLPPGHPEGLCPFTSVQRALFDAAETQRAERSRHHGIPVARNSIHLDSRANDQADDSNEGSEVDSSHTTLDTTLPFTRRLPSGVDAHTSSNSFVCTTCDTRHGNRFSELIEATRCHGDLTAIDRDDIPTVHVGLSLSPGERSNLRYSDVQLAFLKVVYNAHQQRYDTEWEYDIVRDSMDNLRAYTGISGAEFDELVLDGLLSIDGTYPQMLYTVTPDGRQVIDAPHREGRAHGDGVGDLSESSMHVMMVELMRRGFESHFVDDPEHPGVEVSVYYPVDDGRLDVALLDAEGDIIVTGEAERSNHDTLRAAPSDYDKMAACEPEQAIWLVERRDEGHEVINALHNPGNGEPRVGKTYSENSPLYKVNIDEPGLTEIHTISKFREQFLDT
jgi:DNA helicase HerA-like ATPase